jgi:hypothetical protein
MADYVDAEHRHCSRRICLGKDCGLQARTDRWTVWSGYVSRTSAVIEKRPVAVRLANFTENARPYRDSKDRYHVLGENGASVLSKHRGLAAMKSSWQTDTGNLSCRWSEVGQRVQYDSAWIQEMSVVQSGYLPPVPDFASHSPLGSGEWFVPWRLRWNVPDGRSLV